MKHWMFLAYVQITMQVLHFGNIKLNGLHLILLEETSRNIGLKLSDEDSRNTTRPIDWLYIDTYEFFLITTNHIALTLFSHHFAHKLVIENHLNIYHIIWSKCLHHRRWRELCRLTCYIIILCCQCFRIFLVFCECECLVQVRKG